MEAKLFIINSVIIVKFVVDFTDVIIINWWTEDVLNWL